MRIEERGAPRARSGPTSTPHPPSRERPVRRHVLAVELREERVEGRQGVLRELGRRPRQLGAGRRGPALRGLRPRGRLQRGRQLRDVAHGQAQRGDLGELLAGQGLPLRAGRGGHGAAQRLEGAVDLAHAAALARVGRLAAVLAERRRARARALGGAGARARPQLVRVVIRHRVRARDARAPPPRHHHPGALRHRPVRSADRCSSFIIRKTLSYPLIQNIDKYYTKIFRFPIFDKKYFIT